MNILWTVNTIMPRVGKILGVSTGHAISWIDALSMQIKDLKDVNLSIAFVSDVPKLRKQMIENICFYVIPRDFSKVDYWGQIINDFSPDVIHAYGTELSHNYFLLRDHPEVPTVISLQGILTEYVKHYYAGIDFSIMLRYTKLKDIFLSTGFFTGKKAMAKRVKVEKNILSMARFVEGRSTWDRVSALRINPDLHYYYCPRMIRPSFFEKKWDINKIERHSIFVHQGGYPIKGLHFVIESLSILKQRYPDVKLYLSGTPDVTSRTWKQKLLKSSYRYYINDLIKDLDVKDNIIYTGFLTASEMAEKLEKVHVMVLPSAIENAPNSLSEAMIVGTPTVASFVGGNMDMLDHNKEGFLYCYNEPNMLAEYLSIIFDDDNMANRFSELSSLRARKRHDKDRIIRSLFDIYADVIGKW